MSVHSRSDLALCVLYSTVPYSICFSRFAAHCRRRRPHFCFTIPSACRLPRTGNGNPVRVILIFRAGNIGPVVPYDIRTNKNIFKGGPSFFFRTGGSCLLSCLCRSHDLNCKWGCVDVRTVSVVQHRVKLLCTHTHTIRVPHSALGAVVRRYLPGQRLVGIQVAYGPKRTMVRPARGTQTTYARHCIIHGSYYRLL